MSDFSLSRRDFLKRSAIIAGAFTLAPHARVFGANDDIRVAIVGLGIKGTQHVGLFKKVKGVRVVALCDPDSARTAAAVEKHFKDDAAKPKIYKDMREVYDAKDVDVVCIAAPNHWHVLAGIWACQAGKDVYLEKPMSHTIWEGQQMLAAQAKYNRIIQIGMQSRSDPGLQGARDYIKAGNIGEVEYVRGLYYNHREPIGKVSGPQTPPETLDYALWQGPRPDAPLMRKNVHYDWHWQWPYGNGELGNNMVHMVDIASMLLGFTDFAPRVMSLGGRFGFDDDGVTANTHVVYYDMKPVPMICEIRNLPRRKGETEMDHVGGLRIGVEVKGKDGYYLAYNAGGWFYDNKGKRVKQFPGDGGDSHHQNFIDAVRSRKAESLLATAKMGHLAAGHCHLGNISHRLGKAAYSGEIHKAADSIPLLQKSLSSFNEHLLDNGIDVEKYPRMLGPWLEFDNASQKFKGERADEANALLKDEAYRTGFEVPQLA